MKIVTISTDELRDLINQSVLEALHKPAAKQLEEELIKRKDVAKIFKISLVTLNEWMKTGKIPYYRISSRIFFKKNEILGLLEAQRKK